MARLFKKLCVDNNSHGWVKMSVNLRVSQYDALAGLADELGISRSRVTRRILARFLAELDDDYEPDGLSDLTVKKGSAEPDHR
jgi:hypothetical protein